MRGFFAVIAFGALAACAPPPIPDSGPGAGSPEAQRARDAALANPELPSPYAISGEPYGTPTTTIAGSNSNADIAAETTAALAATAPNTDAAPDDVAPATLNNSGISKENDFGVVSEQQSIESDAARLANNRAQYQVVEPTALPTRTGGSQPNVVAYALQTNNPRGVKVYNRTGLASQSKTQRNCAKYASSDQAQLAFLQAGGPERDRKALDPDGDGYACNWDPAPFRAAVSN